MNSLRRQLTRLATGALLMFGMVSIVTVYWSAQHEANEILDAQLSQVANTLLSIASAGEMAHYAARLNQDTHHYTVPTVFEIWHGPPADRQRLAASTGHPGFGLPPRPGHSERTAGGKRWRLYTLEQSPSGYRVVVAQKQSARARMARETSLVLLLPTLLALPLFAWAVGRVVSKTLQPVDRLAREVQALDTQALTLLDTAMPLPGEIEPLRFAMNTLIQRINVALDAERRFTADAAHELRTPLAALKVQAQVAQRAQNAEIQHHALNQVLSGVNRMTHLVEQLLTLARIDPAHSGMVNTSCDATARLAECCAGFAESAIASGQTLVSDLAPDCKLALEPVWLDIAARNLIDNALRYAGPGARVEVRLWQDSSHCTLSVRDNGPGMSAAERSTLTARFARGEADAEGCGLGLSIVERIAMLAHARLEIRDGLPRADGVGLDVQLRFPRATAS